MVEGNKHTHTHTHTHTYADTGPNEIVLITGS